MQPTRLTAVAVVTLLLLAACAGPGGGDTTAPAGNVDAAVTIENFSFTVDGTASVGGSVLVTNNDGVTHTWTSDDGTFNSGSIAADDTFEFTFDGPGEYSFFCSIHPTMTGTITVTN